MLIYNLSNFRQIYGFIFLFKWTKDRRSRRMMQEQLQAEQFAYDTVIADKIFFAQQVSVYYISFYYCSYNHNDECYPSSSHLPDGNCNLTS